jgi:Family of unknown function (DUF5677)
MGDAMMPDESENKQKVLNSFPEIFVGAATLISLGVELMDRMKPPDFQGLNGRTFILIRSFVARQIQQFRAIVAVCEIGLHDSGEVLIRSLFEGILAIRFVLYEPINANKCSHGLLKRRGELPPIPNGKAGADFRAVLYAGSRLIKMLRDGQAVVDIPEYAMAIPGAVLDGLRTDIVKIEREIGPQWTAEYSKKNFTYSGLSIRQLAESCDLKEFYLKMYPLLCATSHAHDGLSFVRDVSNDTFEFRLTGRIDKVETALQCAGALLAMSLDDISAVFAPDLRAAINRCAQLFNPKSGFPIPRKA